MYLKEYGVWWHNGHCSPHPPLHRNSIVNDCYALLYFYNEPVRLPLLRLWYMEWDFTFMCLWWTGKVRQDWKFDCREMGGITESNGDIDLGKMSPGIQRALGEYM